MKREISLCLVNKFPGEYLNDEREREKEGHGDKSMLIQWSLDKTSKRVGSSARDPSFSSLASMKDEHT